MRRGRLAALRDGCAACGHAATEAHHVVLRSQGGADDEGNLVGLCGRCHSAVHGLPYTVRRAGFRVHGVERRDAEWVARRVGEHIAARRPDTVAYVLAKLGDEPGRAYLERRYRLTLA